MSIGSRMRDRREALGLTQVQLAELLGVTKGAVGNYETSVNSPRASLMYKVFEVLHCDANYLFQDEMKELETDDFTVPEIKMVKKYRKFDILGKEAVDSILDIEYRRATALPESQNENGTKNSEKIIRFTVPQYQEPMSTGYEDEIGIAYAKNTELIKEPPRSTSFIAQVHDDSMEPDYPNGSWVFVHSQVEICVGEVGVFYMGGKKWIKVLGENKLISINPKYNPKPFSEDIRCQGLVIGICDESYFE